MIRLTEVPEELLYAPDTIGYWLRRLPEPIASKALQRLHEYWKDKAEKGLKETALNEGDALNWGFYWGCVPSEHRYWEALCTYYRSSKGSRGNPPELPRSWTDD